MSLFDLPAPMLTRDDFQTLFRSGPDLTVVVIADDEYMVVAVSDAFRVATMTGHEAVAGCPFFRVFPTRSRDPQARGMSDLHALFEQVRGTGAAGTLAARKFEIRRAEVEGGGSEERHWSATVRSVSAPNVEPGSGPVKFLFCRLEDPGAEAASQSAEAANQRAEEGRGIEAASRSEQLRNLAAVSARLNAAHDVNSVLGIVTEEARHLIGARHAFTSIVACPKREKFITVFSDADKSDAASREVFAARNEPAIAALVDELDRPLRADRDDLNEHLALPEALADVPGIAGSTAWLAAPLVGRNARPLGVIQLLDKAGKNFTREDEALIAQLAQIAAVAIENAGLYEELRARDRRKDEFLAMLAHELRNPLAAMRNAVALGSGQADPAEVEWSMEIINRQMSQLSRLIDDLLDVSRITQGKVHLRKERIDAAAVLRAAVEAVSPIIHERQHVLHISLEPGTLGIEADAIRLEQIVNNLLTNAAKYTPKGGAISLAAARDGDSIVIRVKDNGVGIPTERLSGMFELFAQGDRSLARSEGGLGIGLTLVRSLTEMHGGTVQAVSNGVGSGSEFVVRLPAAFGAMTVPASVPASDAGAALVEVAPVRVPSRRVLVVDDNADSARATAVVLRRHGHDVRVAYDGPSAVAAAEAHLPELVFLDIGLPGMDGYEVAARLRQDERLRGVKLIAVSGYGQESDRRRSRELGFDEHLVKPVDPAVIIDLLASGL